MSDGDNIDDLPGRSKAEVGASVASAALSAIPIVGGPAAELFETGSWPESWSKTRRVAAAYDAPGNGLIDIEQPMVRGILDGIPAGSALDVACGTGRHTEYLVELGHRVIAVDASPEMLAQARVKVPEAEFRESDLHDLPLPDDHFDVVVCALALTHVPDLSAALGELTRVLRPGGHLVISDAYGMAAGIRPPVVMIGPNGDPGYLPHANRLTGDYLRAALALGLQVRRCEEPELASRWLTSSST